MSHLGKKKKLRERERVWEKTLCNTTHIGVKELRTDRQQASLCTAYNTFLVFVSLCVCVCACMSVCEREKRWHRARWNGDFFRWLHTFLILLPNHPWQTALAIAKGEAGRGKKLWWEQRRSLQFCKHSIINATCRWHLKCHLYMMQSSMCHFQMTVMALTGRLPPSQYKRLAAETCYHLSNCKKKTLADNTINTDCKIWNNCSSWKPSQP